MPREARVDGRPAVDRRDDDLVDEGPGVGDDEDLALAREELRRREDEGPGGELRGELGREARSERIGESERRRLRRGNR